MDDSADVNFQSITPQQALTTLSQGELALDHMLPWGSNYTFLIYAAHAGFKIPAVYKPTRGERPLWDFPNGTLAKREVAAYMVATSIGWHFIPPTVYRDGPHGPGSVQFYVDVDPDNHYFNFTSKDEQQLRTIVLFDALANNADRKSGHVLCDGQGHYWGIDHGLCFNQDYKLRTVVWDFAGDNIPPNLINDMQNLLTYTEPGQELHTMLNQLLLSWEIDALRRRTRQLINRGNFPQPGPGRNYPWPPV